MLCFPPILRVALVAAATCLFAAVAVAAPPIAMQGLLRSAAGGPVADGKYTLVVQLYDAVDAADSVFKEIHVGLLVSQGLFHAALGGADPKVPPPQLLYSDHPDLWVGVSVDGDPELPRVRLGTVPYARHADVATALAGPLSGAQIQVASLPDTALAFNYAGSKSKGGAAEEAVHATLADKALVADKATSADTAAQADLAKNAISATSADEAKSAQTAAKLQCTGCVTLAHLAADVAEGFVSTKGGKIDGALEVGGGVDLAGSTLKNARLAAIDAGQDACGGDDVGRVGVDAKNGKLYYCNGATWKQLLTCDGGCKAAAVVACGQPIPTDCGDLGGCNGTGSLCDGGKVCAAGKCLGLGESEASAAKSCKAILDADPAAADGEWWLDFDGDGGAPPQSYTCDMQDGGWTLLSLDDFQASADGWSPSERTTCGGFGTILGGYGQFGSGVTATRTWTGLPDHSEAKVAFRYVKIDTWDNETAWLQVDGKQVWTKVGGHEGAQTCGNGTGDATWDVKQVVGHTAATVKATFGSTIDQGATDEAWGVDNVALWVR